MGIKCKHKLKKQSKLGMNPSTAAHRLRMDVLYHYVTRSGNDSCYQCGEKLTRGTFSIDHKIPWLNSESPLELFFDIDNIAFSHLSCNSRAASNPRTGKYTHGSNSTYDKGCRCGPCKEAKSIKNKKRIR